MRPDQRTKILLALIAIILGAGLVEAVSEDVWDLAGVFGFGLVVLSLLVVRVASRRPSVPIRADLVGWLAEQSAISDEPMEIIADRCLAAARAGLVEPAPVTD